MWTMGTALRIVTDWVGDPSRVARCSVRFVRPVLVPDDDEGTPVEVTGAVSAVTEDTLTVTLQVLHEGEKVLGAAKVEVRR